MGKHSAKSKKKPGNVMSVGPVWLKDVYRTIKDSTGKRRLVLYKKYTPHEGPNRHARRAAHVMAVREARLLGLA